MSFSTFRAEALAVCGIFAVLTLLYYLTTSKAPSQWGKTEIHRYQADLFSVRFFSKHFSDRRDFFVAQKFSGFFGVRGLRAGNPAQIGFPERLSWVMEGAQKKYGKVCVGCWSCCSFWRFLDENWFWSYDWKVPEVFLGKIGPPSK